MPYHLSHPAGRRRNDQSVTAILMYDAKSPSESWSNRLHTKLVQESGRFIHLYQVRGEPRPLWLAAGNIKILARSRRIMTAVPSFELFFRSSPTWIQSLGESIDTSAWHFQHHQS